MLILALALVAAGGLEAMELFRTGADGYAHFRIPGIVVTQKGTLLAYAEARKSLRGDWGSIDIVLRRSTDRGKTWSPFRVISQVEGPKAKNPVALAQKLAEPGDVTYNNPVAIADRKPGVVHFLFCLEYMRAFYMRSEDDGVSFSKPVEITGAFEGFRLEYAWKVLATGPGHGIQLKNGRLLVPVWLSLGTGGHAHRPSVSATIYSDDRGKSWRRGEIAVPDSAEFVFPNETSAAQLSDGRVMLNVRTESQSRRRTVVVSKNGVSGWSAARFDDALLEPICFGSLLSLGGKRLVFSNPDWLGDHRERKNLTVQLSLDDGKTWKSKRLIEAGGAGYSDLAVGPDGTIYCFYEAGAPTAALQLARFRREWFQ